MLAVAGDAGRKVSKANTFYIYVSGSAVRSSVNQDDVSYKRFSYASGLWVGTSVFGNYRLIIMDGTAV